MHGSPGWEFAGTEPKKLLSLERKDREQPLFEIILDQKSKNLYFTSSKLDRHYKLSCECIMPSDPFQCFTSGNYTEELIYHEQKYS